MKLSAKFLINVESVNNFDYVDQWDVSEGSAHRLHFQLIDKQMGDLRYLSQATVLGPVTVTFLSVVDGSEIVKIATQPFADDKSVWYIDLLATEVPNAGAVKMSISEDAVISQFRVDLAIVVDLLDAGSC